MKYILAKVLDKSSDYCGQIVALRRVQKENSQYHAAYVHISDKRSINHEFVLKSGYLEFICEINENNKLFKLLFL